MPKLALFAALSGALALTVSWVFGGHAFINYDTAYALLWGRDLLDGVKPDIEVPLAPTPHPLQTLWSVVLGASGTEVLSYVALGVAGALVFRLGQLWFGVAAGAQSPTAAEDAGTLGTSAIPAATVAASAASRLERFVTWIRMRDHSSPS